MGPPKVPTLGFRVQGSGFRFGVWGLGFGVSIQWQNDGGQDAWTKSLRPRVACRAGAVGPGPVNPVDPCLEVHGN